MSQRHVARLAAVVVLLAAAGPLADPVADDETPEPRPPEAASVPAEEAPPPVRGDRGVVSSLAVYVTDDVGDRVVVVNRASDEVFATVGVGKRPRGLAAGELGRVAYVANSGDDTLSVLDTLEHRVVDTLHLKGGCRPEDVALTPDGQRLVVSCPGLNLVSVLAPLSKAPLGDVELARAPGRVATSADGRTGYALVPEGQQVAAFDLLRLGAPTLAAVDGEPSAIAVDPRSGIVFVTHARTPLVMLLDARLANHGRLQLGTPTFGIALERDGRRALVAGGLGAGVALVGVEVGTVIRRWPAARGFHLALDPDGRRAYLTGGARGDLTILDRAAGRVLGVVPVGQGAFDVEVIP